MGVSNEKESALVSFLKKGEPFVWLTGLGLTAILFMLFSVFYVIAQNGLGVFLAGACL